jgi:hypothetical protein
MATPELRTLRHNYKVAYTSYLSCVQKLSDASQKGECPPDAVLIGEEEALNNLNGSRRALLNALCRHHSIGGP